MSQPLQFRCDVTPELVTRAEPQLHQLLRWWIERWQEQTRPRRQRAFRFLRWAGLSLSLLGIGVTGVGIALTPVSSCRSDDSVLLLDGVMAAFVVAATVFAFGERLRPALEAWALRLADRQARQTAGRARRLAPYAAAYELAGGRLTGRVERPRFVGVTDLRRVTCAAFSADLACLYGGRWPRLVKRLVWLPDGSTAAALRKSLEGERIEIVDLPATTR